MSDNNTMRPGVSRLWKIRTFAVFGTTALALGIGVAVLHFRAEKRRTWAEIQRRLDALRAAGEPVTSDDLAKLHPDPPPERDAARLLAPAIAALRLPGPSIHVPRLSGPEVPSRGQAITEEMRTNIEAVLDDNQTALNAIPWDSITNAWIGMRFSLGFSNLEANPVPVDTELPRMLCLKAIFEAETGHGTTATEDLRHALALFRTIQTAWPSKLLYRRRGEAYVCAALEWVINRTEIRPDDLKAVERMLSDDHPQGLREALVELRCQNIWDMNTIRADPVNAMYPRSVYGSGSVGSVKYYMNAGLIGAFARIYSDSDFADMLDARSAQIAALELPPKQCFAEFDRVERVARESGHPSFASGGAGAARDLSSRPRLDSEARAKMRVTRVALEIERWRLAHGGRAPDSLAELVPEYAPSIPLDPFDNNPLRYRQLPRGFLVYSIGADFTDDGGKEKTTAAEVNSEHYDITFSVER
jgi:hypothetical protein